MRVPHLFPVITLSVAPLAAETHWAYMPPQPYPAARDANHIVDTILAASWKQAGLRPAELATPRRWVERAAFTLTGLPPSAEQIRRLEASPDESTWLALIDELLATPAYAERWARHWMDVARYADTQGYNFDRDNRYPFAYTYRDWLIRAFREDMPYGRFVQLQLAADHLTDRADHPDLAALGFITVGPRSGGPETIDDRVDVITRGFLSSTVSCARCHEHKTDPITMEDYYSIYSILENTVEPEEKPVIGTPADSAAHKAFLAEMETWQQADKAARREILDHLTRPETLATYLELAWAAHGGDWDEGKTTAESFKRGRFRAKAVLRWRDFLRKSIADAPPDSPVSRWAAAMQQAGENPEALQAACLALAYELHHAPPESPLGQLARKPDSPLALPPGRVHEIMDVQDNQENAKRESERSRLQAEHPGSPPRAMSLRDRPQYQDARTYHRGNPHAPGSTFERQWLSFLGSGAFPADRSPRLALAERISSPENPLTHRVMVNRVWAWHFGEPLADPGDFGPQETEPRLLDLLDELALRFQKSGGSLKDLHRLILTSRAFRLTADGPASNNSIDEANTLFWKWNRRRADFEATRDRLLHTAGSLDPGIQGGRSVALDSEAADSRRSLYAFVDRYALPSTFVSFDLPHPDHHAPRRIETTVPQQALWFLNGPAILRQAQRLAKHPDFTAISSPESRIAFLFQRIHHREPTKAETKAILAWFGGIDSATYQPKLTGTWRVLHTPDTSSPHHHAQPFPIFADGVWKTGPDPATAPIRWLHAGSQGGHSAANHTLILRWQALSSGQARLSGTIRRSQQGGQALEWRIMSSNTPDQALQTAALDPEAHAAPASPWLNVRSGDFIDFHLRAPHGDAFGGFHWDFQIHGRESDKSPEMEISRLRDDFPTTDSAPPQNPAGDPWADLIQMLWASNEFVFID